MKQLVIISFIIFHAQFLQAQTKAPATFIGNFTDDYKITYAINDSLWTQNPKSRYHILKWNTEKQYIITRNDTQNPSDGGLYTRIDYMTFENMAPFLWGFCLTAYNKASQEEAEAVTIADRANPRKGCNGFPFSRMKRQ